ncbi:hypothetical protein [Escherichia coli]|uniref:hypothetical protein n=1 Tax=Escherichia coli TaxID=562 RepID=UPI00165E6DCA|nr:hypothetical protein [Escherichia coli]MDZ9611649.1 hypothetical protein [Escherichia coli]
MSDNPDRKQPDNHSVPCIRGHLLQDGCLFQLQTSRDDIRAAFTEEEARWLEQACESEPGPQGAVSLMIYPTPDESTLSEEPLNDEDHNHST